MIVLHKELISELAIEGIKTNLKKKKKKGNLNQHIPLLDALA